MRAAELEHKVLGLVDAVRLKQPVESSHIELKAEWPEPRKAARSLAAHCNASRGDPVLWIIGLDENRGVVGAAKKELADWWPQLLREFDGHWPVLAQNVSVPVDDLTVVALIFEPTSAPYVIRNPVAGLEGSGPVQFEVPWREGNATRSARRNDLLKVLVPAVKAPELELVEAEAHFCVGLPERWWGCLDLVIHATVRSEVTLVAHRTQLQTNPPNLELRLDSGGVLFVDAADPHLGEMRRDITLDRHGAIRVQFRGNVEAIGPDLPHEFTIQAEFGVIDLPSRPSVSALFARTRQSTDLVNYEWRRR